MVMAVTLVLFGLGFYALGKQLKKPSKPIFLPERKDKTITSWALTRKNDLVESKSTGK